MAGRALWANLSKPIPQRGDGWAPGPAATSIAGDISFCRARGMESICVPREAVRVERRRAARYGKYLEVISVTDKPVQKDLITDATVEIAIAAAQGIPIPKGANIRRYEMRAALRTVEKELEAAVVRNGGPGVRLGSAKGKPDTK